MKILKLDMIEILKLDLIEICLRTCDKNSTLRSFVPLAMFDYEYVFYNVVWVNDIIFNLIQVT